MSARPAVGLLWRGDPTAPIAETRYWERLGPLRGALSAAGLDPVSVLYSEATHDAASSAIEACAGVLVWVDPVTDGIGRADLNDLLERVQRSGRWVSADPRTIGAIGTKAVLADFQDLSWGVPSEVHRTSDALTEALRDAAAQGRAVVVKPLRGNGGANVWKVAPSPAAKDSVRVQDAGRRDDHIEVVTLQPFVEAYWRAVGAVGVVVQQYVDGLRRGMVRAYVSEDRVVGFCTQQPSVAADPTDDPGTDPVFAMAAPKTMFPPDDGGFHDLRSSLEADWIPAVLQRASLGPLDLPVIWDLDFLMDGDASPRGWRYVLCEVNVSCVSPVPPFAVDDMVRSVLRRNAATA